MDRRIPHRSWYVSILMAVATLIAASTAIAEAPEVPRGKGEFCVEPTSVMRKDHMKFLLHQRDKTVHQGIRTKKHSLNECVTCHVQTNSDGSFIPIDAPEQFCQVCHEFASVKLDCFECHATTPDEKVTGLGELIDSKQLSNHLYPGGSKVSAMSFSIGHGSEIFVEVKSMPTVGLSRPTVLHP